MNPVMRRPVRPHNVLITDPVWRVVFHYIISPHQLAC